MVRFSLFGIPVEIQAGFWLIAVLLDLDTLLQGQHKFLILVWIGVVLVSILAHELGHALAMMRHGLRPEITLHTLGGLTAARDLGRLTRPQRIFISFAGPLAGFIIGALVYVLTRAAPALLTPPVAGASSVAIAQYDVVVQLLSVNIGWGIINLIPVLPLDGGHILEDVLGPKRRRVTATISLLAGLSITIWCLSIKQLWIAFIFGLSTMQSFQRFRAEAGEQSPARRAPAPPPSKPIDPEIQAKLDEAGEALADDRYDEAGTLAELVLASQPSEAARVAALQIIGWAHLLEGRADEAVRVLQAIGPHGAADPALVGATLLAKERGGEARQVFEAARASGDERKEIVGPLIQILVEQDEVARAAAIALDIVDSLSEEDARQMASIAFEHGAHPWASRLREAVFERAGEADDAYEAARSRALDGDPSGALVLLRRAVAAGFSDAARVWSDKALEALRAGEVVAELEALIPRERPAD